MVTETQTEIKTHELDGADMYLICMQEEAEIIADELEKLNANGLGVFRP